MTARKRNMATDGPDPLDVAVGVRVRLRRRFIGLSQTDLARGLGVTFQQVQKYERGTNRVSTSTLVRTAAVLGTTVAALVGETEGVAAPVSSVIGEIEMTPDAAQLLTAFVEIKDGPVRRALVTVAQGVALLGLRKGRR